MIPLMSGALDARLTASEGLIRDLVPTVRAQSVASEAEGVAVPLGSFPDDFLRAIIDTAMPRRFRGRRPAVFEALTEAELRSLLAFAGGYSDPASTLALPGASLSGATVEAVGDERQQDRFFGRWTDDSTTRSFFGVTEPGYGTNAQLLAARFAPDTRLLSGGKRWIGNLTNASVGVVFARSAPSPLGIGAYLLELPAPGATVVPLQMSGMRTAGLGELRLTDVSVAEEDILGSHLPLSRRGLWGMTRAFLRMRMQVASMALGAGSALLDELDDAFAVQSHQRLQGLHAEGVALARMVWTCAGELETQGAEGRSSLCKAACVSWATRVAIFAGASREGNRPLITKLVRDVVGLEFMEGVGPKQRQIIATAWLRQKEVPKDARSER
jgi:alkylation response protein AidB-like acyl-CoA dehydrogenase